MKPPNSDANAVSDARPAQALSVADAQNSIARAIKPITATERVGLMRALERVLAETVICPIDVPAHDNAAMDGYAFSGAALTATPPIRLRVSGLALAGHAHETLVAPGTCVRIMTGAVMPRGCDTVIPQEQVKVDHGEIEIPSGQFAGQHRRLQGEDLRRGEPAISGGTRLGPAELGLLASLGVADVTVRRRIRVAFFSTGDELRSLGQPLEEGCVYDSNRYTLFGMLSRLGVEIIDLGVVRDQPEALREAIRSASEADAMITTGGVSVGEADYTRDILGELGDVAFWRIAMKPGRPMAFGHIGTPSHSAYFFGLPGNPVAVMVTFYAFVRDALARLAGATTDPLPMISARSDGPFRKAPGRTEYQRAFAYLAADGWHVRSTGAQGSGILSSMSQANCLIVLAHDSGAVAAGDTVFALPFYGLV